MKGKNYFVLMADAEGNLNLIDKAISYNEVMQRYPCTREIQYRGIGQ